MLARGEPITFLAQVSFLGLLSKFESIDELSLGVLPMGQSILICPFSFEASVANAALDLVRHLLILLLVCYFANGPLS